MDGPHIDHRDQPATATGQRGRRGALRAVGAVGVALLAALGRTDGAAAKGFQTKQVVSDASAPLAATTSAATNTSVTCNGGKLLSCGYIVNGGASDLLNAMVVLSGPVDKTTCGAALFRTDGTGATAGGTIRAVALCRI
jgi:hypothetical protein